MEAHAWDAHFLTGEVDVDAEHRELFRIIEEVGSHCLAEAGERPVDVDRVLAPLLAYAYHHFRHEEAWMISRGVDARHVDAHRQIHADFSRQLEEMRQTTNEDGVAPLLGFLTHWLTYHILGTDQSLARQVAAIRQGVPAAEAYAREAARENDPATAGLLEALHGLYRMVSARNQALARLNADLESRVEARTAAYADANRSLAEEHRRLKDTLCALEATQRQLIESERKRAALDTQRKMQLLLSQIVDGDPVPTLVINADHKVTHWNKACAAVSGLPASEMIGTNRQWRPFYASERPILADLIVDGCFQSALTEFYGGKVRRSPVIEGAFEAEDFFPQCGEAGRWLYFTAAPLHDAEGRIIGAIETLQDVTERHRAEDELRSYQAELERKVEQRTAELVRRNGELTRLNAQLSETREQLIQSEKLASIGQLAAGVAHEINNPIGYVFSNVGTLDGYVGKLLGLLARYQAVEGELPAARQAELATLREEIDLDFLREDIPMLVGESREGITRVKKIVQDLKDFSRVDTTQSWQWSDVHRGLDSTINIVANEIKYKADVVREYGKLPEIECLPMQLNQVFMNLLMNAAQAMGEGHGRIVIRSGQAGADTVWLEFEDNGAGMSPEVQARIFDPFFTTKPVGKGTGLGLSLSYGIIKNHHGSIDVHSTPGSGTCFRITLPVSQSSSVPGAGAEENA